MSVCVEFPITEPVKSLCWRGDELVYWVDGERILRRDGMSPPRLGLSFSFDAAMQSESGRFAFVYQRLGTKGVLLDRGKLIREVPVIAMKPWKRRFAVGDERAVMVVRIGERAEERVAGQTG